MNSAPRQISLEEWSDRYDELRRAGLHELSYGGPLARHVLRRCGTAASSRHSACEADATGPTPTAHRLSCLRLDNSPAALRLWNFLLSEEDRLHTARAEGKLIVGAMKDLGTVPVMAFSLPNVLAFYPDGAWWIPCILQQSSRALDVADDLGIDDSFCPVRAMLGAIVSGEHFPRPDVLVCSAGATCDDFSAIAQRLYSLDFDVHWWEIPHRRSHTCWHDTRPASGLTAPIPMPASDQVAFVAGELDGVRDVLAQLAGRPLTDDMLVDGIVQANRTRAMLAELRRLVYTAPICPLGSLEMLVAEMLAIHYCSDRDEAQAVLEELLGEVRRRVRAGTGVLLGGAVRVFWVNPVADLWVMNLLESCGGRVCGSDYMFTHALDVIPESGPPLEALARMALADPMVGTSADRARRIIADAQAFGAEAVIISRIPGASHCAMEGAVISDMIARSSALPVLEIEVPSVADAMRANLQTRLEALIETSRHRRE